MLSVLRYEGSPPDGADSGLLLVIFTSMKNTTDRDIIQSNTIRNWAQFIPKVCMYNKVHKLRNKLSPVSDCV